MINHHFPPFNIQIRNWLESRTHSPGSFKFKDENSLVNDDMVEVNLYDNFFLNYCNRGRSLSLWHKSEVLEFPWFNLPRIARYITFKAPLAWEWTEQRVWLSETEIKDVKIHLTQAMHALGCDLVLFEYDEMLENEPEREYQFTEKFQKALPDYSRIPKVEIKSDSSLKIASYFLPETVICELNYERNSVCEGKLTGLIVTPDMPCYHRVELEFHANPIGIIRLNEENYRGFCFTENKGGIISKIDLLMPPELIKEVESRLSKEETCKTYLALRFSLQNLDEGYVKHQCIVDFRILATAEAALLTSEQFLTELSIDN